MERLRKDSPQQSTPANGDTGVSTVETAIFLPLLLVAIFIAIGLGVLANARASLGSAMTSAVRLGATRGNIQMMGDVHLIEKVNTYLGTGNTLTLQNIITSGDVDISEAATLLDRCLPFVYGGSVNLRDLPPQIIYTLIYINQALRQSIGPSLRFPCVPKDGNPPTSDSSNCLKSDASGCAACYLLNPASLNFALSSTPPDPNFFAIRCEYHPSNIFIDPILKGLALLTGGTGDVANRLVITRDAFFELGRVGNE